MDYQQFYEISIAKLPKPETMSARNLNPMYGIQKPLTREVVTEKSENNPKDTRMVESWFKTEQIETYIGEYPDGARAQLVVMHQCGNNKDWLIEQLKTMIQNLESNGENFAG